MKTNPTAPFILSLHDAKEPTLRDLRDEEFAQVAGGSCDPGEVPTMKATPNGDGGDDGCDADPTLNYGP